MLLISSALRGPCEANNHLDLYFYHIHEYFYFDGNDFLCYLKDLNIQKD